jgi:hypothetical protein
MTAAADLAARADRVKAIAEAVHGKVISRDRNTMLIEVPADTITGAVTLFGMGGFSATIGKQSTRLAPRRVIDMGGNTIVCENDPVTTSFFTYTVDLRPHSAAVEPQPHAAAIAITRPTRPFGG